LIKEEGFPLLFKPRMGNGFESLRRSRDEYKPPENYNIYGWLNKLLFIVISDFSARKLV
jgi:hypothetical protein